jgi:hypothetical protein
VPPHPKRSEIGKRRKQNQEANGEAYPFVGQRKVDRMVGRRVVDENGEDSEEGSRKECSKPQREAYQQAGKPSQIAQRYAKQIARAEGAGGGGPSMLRYVRHTSRILLYGRRCSKRVGPGDTGH